MKILSFPKAVAPSSARPEVDPEIDCSLQYRVIHGHKRAFIMAGRGPAILLLPGTRTMGRAIFALRRGQVPVRPMHVDPMRVPAAG